MARYKVTPNMAGKTAPLKRGPGRPRKNPVEVVAAKAGKRGRKPGIKNKSFLERVVVQSDAIEAALAGLDETLSDAIMKEGLLKNQELLTVAEAMVKGISETLTDAVGKLSMLPEGYVPGKQEKKPLEWAAGSFVVFKNPLMRAQFKHAYEITSLLELGKGNGNGTMVQLTRIGMFPKSQLELIDGEELEEAKPSHPVAAPVAAMKAARASAPRSNGTAMSAMPSAEILAQAAVIEVDASEDLNA